MILDFIFSFHISYDWLLVIPDAEEMFTNENDCKLMNWLDVAIRIYRDIVDNCVDLTTIFTKEMWIEQAGKIQVKKFHHILKVSCQNSRNYHK